MDTPQKINELLDSYKDKTELDISSIYNTYLRNQTRYAFAEFIVQEDKLVIKKVSPWIGCRGYMCEALFATHGGIKFELEGQHYDLYKSITKQAVCLFLQNTNATRLRKITRLLNSLEEKVGWDKSFCRVFKNKGARASSYFWYGDKRWFSSTAHLSLILMLIRLAWRVDIEQTDTMNTWIQRILTQSEFCDDVNIDDKNTLYMMFGEHSNLIEILMEHQEFLTEDLTYKEDRTEFSQDIAQDSGIYNATYCANKFMSQNIDFDNSEKVQNVINSARLSSAASKINATLALRYSVAIQEYGDNQKIL